MTWKNRIEHIKSAFGIKTNRQLEQTLGLSNGYINDLIGGIKNKNPSKIIVALGEKFKISPVWFFNENVGMFGEEQENILQPESELIQVIRRSENGNEVRFTEIESRLSALERLVSGEDSAPAAYPEEKTAKGGFTAEPEPEYSEEDWIKIPYVHDIAAGPPIEQDEDRSQFILVPARLIKKGQRYYAASIRGSSMSDMGIQDGDTVLIRYCDAPRDGAVMAVRYKGRSTLKRLRETEGNAWELHYEDGTGRTIPVDSGQYEAQGELAAVLSKSSITGQ
jgi:SOS-response transcriptional repressor LexA